MKDPWRNNRNDFLGDVNVKYVYILQFIEVCSSTSKNKIAEREATIIKSYEISGDLTLLFLQVADRYVYDVF